MSHYLIDECVFTGDPRQTWLRYNGPIAPGLEVLHIEKCDGTNCCNLNHLSLGTRSENNRQTDERHGRYKRHLEHEYKLFDQLFDGAAPLDAHIMMEQALLSIKDVQRRQQTGKSWRLRYKRHLERM